MAIIGAGIIGTACAYELAQAGLRVVVVDPNAIGSGATNLGYGSLSVLDQPAALLALTRYGLTLWEKLVEWLPPDCEYRRSGTIWLAFNQDQAQELEAKHDFLQRHGIPAERLTARQLAEAEPGLSEDIAASLLLPGDSWFRASRAAEFLFQLASKQGARHLRQQALSIEDHEVMLKDGSSLFAGNIINAAGNELQALTPSLPLAYSKSHVLVVETPAVCARHQLCAIAAERPADVTGEARFAAYQKQAATSNSTEVWIGSSSQPVADRSASLQVEPKIVAHLLRRAIEIIPAIGRAKPLRSWTGLLAKTADGLPLIGSLPGGSGIFAATGHNGCGATVALATAKLIAAELLSQIPEIDPIPYQPSRFEKTVLNKKEQSSHA